MTDETVSVRWFMAESVLDALRVDAAVYGMCGLMVVVETVADAWCLPTPEAPRV